MAEVMHYPDWSEAGSEAACKAAGKYQMKGKEYIVQDGDVRACADARALPCRAAHTARRPRLTSALPATRPPRARAVYADHLLQVQRALPPRECDAVAAPSRALTHTSRRPPLLR